MRPSAGRVVHYVPDEHSAVLTDRCQAAIVTAAPSADEAAVLTVFPPGEFLLVLSGPVPHDEEGKAPGTWHWPERLPE